MELHKLLQRQLSHANLSDIIMPVDKNQWHEFLVRINNTYNEADQERYLLERSMEISSRELNNLNQKLETAQSLARLGYWSHNIKNNKNAWSKELYLMFGLDFEKPAPSIDAILELTSDLDKARHKECINNAFSKGLNYEIEIRMKSYDEDKRFKWYLVIGEAVKKDEQPIVEISGVMMDITRRKLVDEELSILHDQLITSARKAGMADVATSILHNVGNILNSANVSVELILELTKNPVYEKLLLLGEMIEKNMFQLSEYFSNDTKGKLIPKYLIDLSHELKHNQGLIYSEANNLNTNIKHIKDITTTQQSLSVVSDLTENIYLPELIDSAIKMCGKDLENNSIKLIKIYDGNLYVHTDKSKLLQIIINLIQNAKESLVSSVFNYEKQIIILLKNIATDKIEIGIKDNGVGISSENLGKIFTFGFTTKKNGHGFGLHSSAITAKELGGTLEVSSEGLLKGALFILTLPVSPTIKGNSNEN